MKYLVLYEDYFSIFPSNRFEDIKEVEKEIEKISKNFIEISPYFNMEPGPDGGLTIHNHDFFYTYKVKNFDKHNQIITLDIYDGKEAKMLLSTITMKSKEMKKALLTDFKNRFNIN